MENGSRAIVFYCLYNNEYTGKVMEIIELQSQEMWIQSISKKEERNLTND